MLVQHALGQKAVVGEETRLMEVLVEVAVLGLHGVRGEEHGGVGRAVDLVAQDGVLHLQVEHPLFIEETGLEQMPNNN